LPQNGRMNNLNIMFSGRSTLRETANRFTGMSLLIIIYYMFA